MSTIRVKPISRIKFINCNYFEWVPAYDGGTRHFTLLIISQNLTCYRSENDPVASYTSMDHKSHSFELSAVSYFPFKKC